ncbi:MAG: YheU family protein [bacterium]
MIVIPVESLSAVALQGIIDAFILREGTDYGAIEYSLEQKRDSVRKQLASGEAQICFYPENDHIDIARVDR